MTDLYQLGAGVSFTHFPDPSDETYTIQQFINNCERNFGNLNIVDDAKKLDYLRMRLVKNSNPWLRVEGTAGIKKLD